MTSGDRNFDPEWLSADLDGELSPQEESKLREWLSQSDNAREQRDAMASLDSSLRSYFAIDAKSSAHLNLLAQRAALRSSGRSPRSIFSRSSKLWLLAAALLIGVSAVLAFREIMDNPSSSPEESSLVAQPSSPPIIPGQVVVEAQRTFPFEASAWTRGVVIGPAILLSDPTLPIDERTEIEIVQGILLVEHRVPDRPLRLHIPEGTIELVEGSLRLEVPTPSSRQAEVEVFEGTAFWVERHQRIALRANQRYPLPPHSWDPGLASRVSNANPTMSADMAPTLNGRVVDNSGRPVPGAKISIQAWQEPIRFVRSQAIADDDGAFSIRIPKGIHRFLDVAPTDKTTARRFALPVVPEAGSVIHRHFVVGPGGTLSGRIVDAAGMPLSGAHVVVHSRAEEHSGGIPIAQETERRARADAQGRFQIFHVGPRFRLYAQAKSMSSLEQHIGWIGDGQIVDEIELPLAATASVRGIVVDDQGEPVEGASIILAPKSVGSRFSPMTQIVAPSPPQPQTDERGEFECHVIPSSTPWEIFADKKGHLPTAPQVLNLGAFESQEFRFQLDSGRHLVGHVLDPSGAPVVDGLVHLLVQENGTFRRRVLPSATDQNGVFRFDSLRQGPAWLVAQGGSHLSVSVARSDIGADSTTNRVEITLPHATLTRGQIIDSQGLPVLGAIVEAHPIDLGLRDVDSMAVAALFPGLLKRRVFTDDKGLLDLQGLPQGRIRLRVTPYSMSLTDGDPSLHDEAEVQSGSIDWRVQIDSPRPTIPLTLDVVGADGRELPTFRVSYQFRDGDLEIASEITLGGPDPRDRTFEAFVGGTSELRIQAFGHGTSRLGPFSWPNASASSLKVTMRQSASLEGRLIDSGGRPLSEVSLTFLDVDEQPLRLGVGPERRPLSQFVTGRDGRFHLHDVPQEAWILVAQQGERVFRKRIEGILELSPAREPLDIILE